MNPQIKKELEKVTATDLQFDNNTTSIFIPKTTSWNLTSLKVNKCYVIELDDSLLNPSTNSSLAANWNGGKIPEYKHYMIELSSVMNKMIKVIGVGIVNGVPQGKQFIGWLPFEQVKVLKEV